MDADREVQRLLKESGAELIRDKNHYVYQLPNGAKFTMAKTPSDWRAGKNNLADLRRLLGKPEVSEVSNGIVVEELEYADEGPETSRLEVPKPPKSPMRLKIDAKIDELELERRNAEAVVKEAQAHVARIDADLEKVAKLMVLVDDPAMEEVLSMVLGPSTARRGAGQPHTPQRTWSCEICGAEGSGSVANKRRHMATHREAIQSPPSSVPDRIGSFGQVTKQLVLACTQTFGDSELFTTRQVIDRMTEGVEMSTAERSRVESNIAHVMKVMKDRGEVVQVISPQGRRPASWRKVDLTHIGGGRRTTVE